MMTIEENTTLVGFSELRTKMKLILAALKHSTVVLALRHKPLAVLVPIERYRQMEAMLERMEDSRLGPLAKKRSQLPDAQFIPLDAVERRFRKK